MMFVKMKRKFYLFNILILISIQTFAQEKEISGKIEWKPEKKITYEIASSKVLVNYPYFNNYELNSEGFLRYANKILYKSIFMSENIEITKVEITDFSTQSINYSNLSFFELQEPTSIPIKFWTKNIQGQKYLFYNFSPTILLNNTHVGIKNFTLKINYLTKSQNKKSKQSYVKESVLNSGFWYKIRLQKTDIYTITYEDLQQIGFSNPENVRLFGNGGKLLSKNNADAKPDDLKENKIWHHNNAIYFYAEGPNTWDYNKQTQLFEHSKHEYSDYAYYFLSDKNTGFDNTIETANLPPNSDKTVNTYNYFGYKEQDNVNLVKSGRTWYGDAFDIVDKIDYNFTVTDINTTKNINFTIKAAARSLSNSSISVFYNSQSNSIYYNAVSGSYDAAYAFDEKMNMSFATQNSNEHIFTLQYNRPTSSAKAWLDYVEINCFKNLKYNNSNFKFRNIEIIESGKVANYQISNCNSNCVIWNINNKNIINYTLNNSTANFNYATDTLEEFIIFEPKNALYPELTGNRTGEISNQNLHNISEADMIIIYPKIFQDEAQELADFHLQTDDLITEIVDIESIYNEFSNGTPDIAAIRNFLIMVYKKSIATSHPLHLLAIFGDGTYKNKTLISENWNMIPTYQSVNSTSPVASFVSDDFFGMLDDDEYETVGNLDIGIGRIPVDTKREAQEFIAKVKNYYSSNSRGSWKNVITLVADDEDSNTYFHDTENYADYIEKNYPVFNLDKIYLDAYKQETTTAGDRYPDVVRAINERMQKGSLIFNYVGHGNEYRLAHEKIIDINNINSWENYNSLPIFMTATCEFSRYDNSDITSAGEQVLLNPKGGSIAMFSTTRLVYSGSNDEINTNFYKNVFKIDTISKKQLYLGDIVKQAKLLTGSPANINKRNFSLLGDPALRLLYPNRKAKITEIQQQPVTYNINGSAELISDTIKALKKVNIKGVILNFDNTINTDFVGKIVPCIFDKKMPRQTLANDGGLPQKFNLQNNQIFKGNASINNGQFSIDFIVPKDINLAYEKGKISLYFYEKGQAEGNAQFTQFIIGGIDTSAIEDKNGPEIQLYLNDQNFVSGGLSNQNPIIYALLNDSSGINTSSASIGHDITAILDNNTTNTITLNNFYEAELDNFQAGKIQYQLNNLEAGEHNLTLKVWDVYNNSSEKSINFVVADNAKLEIRHLFNYPNPFFTQTAFYFEHNSPNVEITLVIHIFSISGKLIKTIHQNMISTGYISNAIYWNGRDDFGQKIGRGTYFYRLRIKTNDGKSAEKIEKLVILN